MKPPYGWNKKSFPKDDWDKQFIEERTCFCNNKMTQMKYNAWFCYKCGNTSILITNPKKRKEDLAALSLG